MKCNFCKEVYRQAAVVSELLKRPSKGAQMKHCKQLTEEQRYQISGLKKAGLNQSQIADEVGVHKSTISREFGRNKGHRGWCPRQAQELRDERRKQCINVQRHSLLEWAEVERLIRLDMSPEQASCRLALECGLRISHDTCTFMKTNAEVATYGNTCATRNHAENVTRAVKSAGARSRTGSALTNARGLSIRRAA